MQALIDFISGIGSAIQGFFSFVFGLVEDLIYLVTLTGAFLAKIPTYLAWLPAEAMALIVILIAIVVLYKLFGRD